MILHPSVNSVLRQEERSRPGRKYKTAAEYDVDGLTPPRWCGTVVPRATVVDRLGRSSIPCGKTP